MIRFDKMKIVTQIEYITAIDMNAFTVQKKGEEVLYYKYHQKSPFHLVIMKNIQHRELTIEFTGKILCNLYTELINLYTIRECLLQINRLGMCVLDTDAIITHSNVIKCDVTKDVDCNQLTSVTNTIRANLSNYKKWTAKVYRSEGITLENAVKTPRYKKRLIIYDKSKEMQSCENKQFYRNVSNAEEISAYFSNKIRFELNINTMDQIRKLLEIKSNDLLSVLLSKANPIACVLDEALQFNAYQQTPMTVRDMERMAFMEKFNYDMSAIEAQVRAVSAKNTSIKRTMQPYKELYERMKVHNDPDIDIRALVA